jgi:DNA-binding transcriptional LysR family regulator
MPWLGFLVDPDLRPVRQQGCQFADDIGGEETAGQVRHLPSRLPTPTPTSDGPVELGDLSGKPLVMVGEGCGLSTFTRTLFAQAGAELRPYPGEADSYRSLQEWAHLGLGGALLPRSKFGTDEPTRPLLDAGQPVQIRYEARWFTHSTRASAIETLLDTITAST